MTDNLPLILQLDVAGNPARWITYENAAYYATKELIAWSIGSDNVTLHGGIQRITGQQSILKLDTIIAIRGRVNDKQFRQMNRVPLSNHTLFRRDQQICAYCVTRFPVKGLTRDHIIPTSRGGKNVWANVVSACGHCNKHKDDHLAEEVGMQLHFIPYAPNRAEYLILANRKILADQMDFLMKTVPAQSRLHD